MDSLAGEVSIHMIEPGDGRSLQRWVFRYPDVERIAIGRGEDAHVKLADPYVSRTHLEIIRQAEDWYLHARGRNGVFVEGRSVTECKLAHGTQFRLSLVGPTFRFDSEGESAGVQTLSVDQSVLNLMTFNRQEVTQQADEIAETDYFKQLQEKARKLREQRSNQ